MKELYEELKLEVISFKTEDIITTSDAATDQDQGQSQEQTGTDQGQGQNESDYTPTDRYINGQQIYLGPDDNDYFFEDGKYVPVLYPTVS